MKGQALNDVRPAWIRRREGPGVKVPVSCPASRAGPALTGPASVPAPAPPPAHLQPLKVTFPRRKRSWGTGIAQLRRC